MISDKVREKRERLIQFAKGSTGEPIVTEQNYQLELVKALSYYGNFYDLKTRRSWASKYFKKHGMLEQSKITDGDASDYHFSQVGSVCRLLDRGQYISEFDKNKIFNKIFDIHETNLKIKEENKRFQKPAPAVDKNETITDQVMDHLNGEIDKFILTKSTDFSPSVYFKTNDVPNVVAKNVSEILSKLTKELSEIDQSEDLTEGYSNFSKREMKKFREMIDGIISACGQQKVSSNKVKKVRKVKEKPVSVQVNKVKYAIKGNVGEIELKSVPPESLIGAKEVWLYYMNHRNVHVYKSDTGMSVNGTRLVDFSVEKSVGKKIRNPEKFLLTPLAKSSLADEFKKLATKEFSPNGRMSEETIILKVFK